MTEQNSSVNQKVDSLFGRASDLDNQADNEQDDNRPEIVGVHSKARTIGFSALGIVVGGVLVTGIAYGKYTTDFMAAAVASSVTTEKNLDIVDNGHGAVYKIDTNIDEVTLTTANTLVTGATATIDQATKVFEWTVFTEPYTVTRIGDVEQDINIKTGDIEGTYNVDEKSLEITVSDTAISTETHFSSIGASTTEETGVPGGFLGSATSNISNSIDAQLQKTGLDADNKKVPFLKDVVSGTLGIRQGVEKIIDLKMLTGVAEECTPKILATDGVKAEIKKTIEDLVKTKLLTKGAFSNSTEEGEQALDEMKRPELEALVENATINIPLTWNVQIDPENRDAMNDYAKSEIFDSTLDAAPPMTCGITRNAELMTRDEKASYDKEQKDKSTDSSDSTEDGGTNG